MDVGLPDPAYIIKQVRDNWTSRAFWIRQINVRICRLYYDLRGISGVDVMDEEWDTLVILDGCRYDLFARTIPGFNLEGTLERRRSKGSTSFEFLERNFGERTCEDTVYVTANPFVRTHLSEDMFHAVDHVWVDGWDEERETVLPETMVDRTRAAHEKFPNKRIIAHFMQPHHPFVGDVTIESDRGYIGARSQATGTSTPNWEPIWEQLRHGDVEKEEVWRAYEANLEYALETIEPLVKDLEGRTVISSDHGNGFGERARPFPTTVYGHPRGVRIPELVDVPWFSCTVDSRRDIRGDASETTSVQNVDEATVEQRLKALGYRS